MDSRKDIVITVYGHEKIVDKFAISAFDKSIDEFARNDFYIGNSNAETYCDIINSLELNGNSWVFAKMISKNTLYQPYTLDTFLPLRFDIILKLDDRSIQRMLRELKFKEIAMALKGENETIREKIFSNISKRAAQMLKEDIECMGLVRKIDIIKTQEKILNIIYHLEKIGEIVILHSKGETI